MAQAKGKKDMEVLALRNTSTTTPDTIVRSVGRTGIVGGKMWKKELEAEFNEDVDMQTDTPREKKLAIMCGFHE